MSLPEPYYEKDGITIYNAVIRANCTHGRKRKSEKIQGEKTWRGCAEVATRSQARLCAVSRSRCKANQVWGRTSRMEGRGCVGTCRAVQGTQVVCAATMRGMWGSKSRAASYRREHRKQQPIQYQVCLPTMPHGRGWAS